MSAYTSKHSLAAATGKPHIVWIGSASLKVSLFDLLVGANTAPADNQYEMDVIRCTDAGTTPSATITPQVVGGYGPTAGVVVNGGTYSADPTLTGTSLLTLVFNHRASARFPVRPGFEIESKIAANNGLNLDVTTNGSTATLVANGWHME